MTTLRSAGIVPTWTVGDRLRKAREFAGHNQEHLAATIGIARRSVSAYEADQVTPKRPVLLAWAMACGVDLEWLESGEIPTPHGPGATMGTGKNRDSFHGYTRSHTPRGNTRMRSPRVGRQPSKAA